MHYKIAGSVVGVVLAGMVASLPVAAPFAHVAPDPTGDDHVVASVHRTIVPVEITLDRAGEAVKSLRLFDHHDNAGDEHLPRWQLFDHH